VSIANVMERVGVAVLPDDAMRGGCIAAEIATKDPTDTPQGDVGAVKALTVPHPPGSVAAAIDSRVILAAAVESIHNDPAS
jgi:hypothetical protein